MIERGLIFVAMSLKPFRGSRAAAMCSNAAGGPRDIDGAVGKTAGVLFFSHLAFHAKRAKRMLVQQAFAVRRIRCGFLNV